MRKADMGGQGRSTVAKPLSALRGSTRIARWAFGTSLAILLLTATPALADGSGTLTFTGGWSPVTLEPTFSISSAS